MERKKDRKKEKYEPTKERQMHERKKRKEERRD